MITEDDLRTLLADREVPPGIAPAQARARARTLRTRRRVRNAGVAAVLVPTLVGLVGAAGPVHLFGPFGRGGHLPPAFGADGKELPVGPRGVVALDVPRLRAWADSESVCVGDWDGRAAFVKSDLPGLCWVTGAAVGAAVQGGAIASLSDVPVVRADFILGGETQHAQVTGFAQHPRWRLLTAPWHGPESDEANVLIRGWDSAGKLVFSVGCVGGCPVPAQASAPALQPTVGIPVPAASSAPPTPVPTAVADGRVSVLPGVQAWTTAHGVCVGDGHSSQCVTDGDTHIEDGFALGRGIATTIIGKPLVRAEFVVGSTVVPADVLGFAGHPQWRVVSADLKVPGSADQPVRLRGWDASGALVVDYRPAG